MPLKTYYTEVYVEEINPTAPIQKGVYIQKNIPVTSTNFSDRLGDLNEEMDEMANDEQTHRDILDSLSRIPVKKYPPIVVDAIRKEGKKYTLIDGFHRLLSASLRHSKTIPAFIKIA